MDSYARSEMRAQQTEQLRRYHPDWWIWHSDYPNPRFYAGWKDESGERIKLRADTPGELTREILTRKRQ